MLNQKTRQFIQYMMKTKMSMAKETVAGSDFTGWEDPGNSDASLDEIVDELLLQLTLEEKLSYVSGFDDLAVKSIPRLNIPYVWASDATSGVRCFGPATIFPAAVTMAASWDTERMHQAGVAIAEEARAYGVSILLAPGVNIHRVPTCGRNFEYFGEDPFLSGEMAAAYIQGVQSRGVITTVKHFACNESDYDRHKTNSVVDERTLREIYLAPFKKAVQKGGTQGVMSSYNPVNGIYASENAHLLQDILRDEWGFEGFVMSDWNSLYSTAGPVTNGLDIEMPGPKWLSETRLNKALSEGAITEQAVDGMVRHLLRSFLQMGIFTRPMVDSSFTIRSDEHISCAVDIARAGMVLLKNEQRVLPISSRKAVKIAVLGRNGLAPVPGGGGSSHMGLPPEAEGLAVALRRLTAVGSEVVYIETSQGSIDSRDEEYIAGADYAVIGTGYDNVYESEGYDRMWELPEQEAALIRRVSQLQKQTVVVVFSGGALEAASWAGSVPAILYAGYPGEGASSIPAEILVGKVNPSGKLPFTMAKTWEDYASTHYYVEHPEAMNMARIIGGQGNPKSRKVWDMPYSEGLMVGYRHFDTRKVEPLFAFGHGLSYTDFTLSELSISASQPLPLHANSFGWQVTVSCLVTNSGDRAGSEVVQLYVHDQESKEIRPEQELKGFTKVHLKKGETKTVEVVLQPEDFMYYATELSSWYLEPGSFILRVGTSSRNTALIETIEIV